MYFSTGRASATLTRRLLLSIMVLSPVLSDNVNKRIAEWKVTTSGAKSEKRNPKSETNSNAQNKNRDLYLQVLVST